MVKPLTTAFKRCLLLLLLFSILSGLSSTISAQSHHIMSYNIRYDNPRDGDNSWDQRKAALTALLAYYQPGIFGIQEGLQHQLAYIDSTLREYKYIGVGRDDRKPNNYHVSDHLPVLVELHFPKKLF